MERRFAPPRRKLRVMGIAALIMCLVLLLILAALFLSLMEVAAVAQALLYVAVAVAFTLWPLAWLIHRLPWEQASADERESDVSS